MDEYLMKKQDIYITVKILFTYQKPVNYRGEINKYFLYQLFKLTTAKDDSVLCGMPACSQYLLGI